MFLKKFNLHYLYQKEGGWDVGGKHGDTLLKDKQQTEEEWGREYFT